MTDVFNITPDKIDFFDQAKVGLSARRLAFSFNVAARLFPQDDDPLPQAEKLFLSTTGLDKVPEFNKDEVNYLRLKLVETASILGEGRSTSLRQIQEAGAVLFMKAQISNLIRREDTFDTRKDLTSSCGAEGP